MSRDRVYDLQEARSGWRSAARRTEVPRLAPPPHAPWLGQLVRLQQQGQPRDFALAGGMAAALGVSRDTLLRLELRGVVPPAHFHVPGRWPGHGRRARCYPVEQVLSVASWIDAHDLRGRRLSLQRQLVTPALVRFAEQTLRPQPLSEVRPAAPSARPG